MESKFREIQFSDSDMVNIRDWVQPGEYNPYNMRPWLLHDAGFTLAVVFATCLQDAIDEAVDAGKLDRFQLSEEDMKDYPDDEGISWLGNAGEPFDIESLEIMELPIPEMSFCASFNAAGFGAEWKPVR